MTKSPTDSFKVEANYLNAQIYKQLSVSDDIKDISKVPLLLTSTSLAQSQFGGESDSEGGVGDARRTGRTFGPGFPWQSGHHGPRHRTEPRLAGLR